MKRLRLAARSRRLLMAQAQARARPRRVAARHRDRLQLHRRRTAAVRRDPLSRRSRCPSATGRPTSSWWSRARPSRSWCARRRRSPASGSMPPAARYRSAPSFYAVASSRPIARARRRAHARDLRARARQPAALARVQRAAGRAGAVRARAGRSEAPRRPLLRGARARSRSPTACSTAPASTIPARVPVGRFTAETFLIRDGRVLAAAVRDIDIRKSGFERFVARAADRSSLLYGLVAVALSVAGSAGLRGLSRAARSDRRSRTQSLRFVGIAVRALSSRGRRLMTEMPGAIAVRLRSPRHRRARRPARAIGFVLEIAGSSEPGGVRSAPRSTCADASRRSRRRQRRARSAARSRCASAPPG